MQRKKRAEVCSLSPESKKYLMFRLDFDSIFSPEPTPLESICLFPKRNSTGKEHVIDIKD